MSKEQTNIEHLKEELERKVKPILEERKFDWTYLAFLSDYMDILTGEPILKKIIIDDLVDKKRALDEKIVRLEQEAEEEIWVVFKKLVKDIKKAGIQDEQLKKLILESENFRKKLIWSSRSSAENISSNVIDILEKVNVIGPDITDKYWEDHEEYLSGGIVAKGKRLKQREVFSKLTKTKEYLKKRNETDLWGLLIKLDRAHQVFQIYREVVFADLRGFFLPDPELGNLTLEYEAQQIDKAVRGGLRNSEGIARFDYRSYILRLHNFLISELNKKVFSSSRVNKLDNAQSSAKETGVPMVRKTGQPVLWIERPKTREILVNGEYFLSQPDFGSENDSFFESVFNHPELEKITIKSIEKEQKTQIKKSPHQILADLGFVGEIKKAFFPNVSRKAVQFQSKLTEEDLRGLNIDKESLKSQLQNLKRYEKQKDVTRNNKIS